MKLSSSELNNCDNCGSSDKKTKKFEAESLCFECAKDLLEPEDFREYLENN